MLIAAPFGFYGSGNIGDEATLKGFAALTALSGAPIKAIFAAQNPAHTRAVEPAFTYHQYTGLIGGVWPRVAAHAARAYVFAGGTPIMDGLGEWPLTTLAPMVEHGRIWGKPSVFVGIGTERLERAQSRAIVSERIIPNTAFWSVRAEADRERLLELGAAPERVIVAADMAWLLAPAGLDYGRAALAQHGSGDGPLIGVNINAEANVMARAPQLFQQLAETLDALIEARNARVIFLFNEVREEETFDVAAARAVMALMRRPDRAVLSRNDYLAPQEMMSIIGCCALTISTRYHFCLFSALQGVPFLPIKRSDKVSDLSADLGWPYGAAPEDISALTAQALALLDAPRPAREALGARVSIMNGRAKENLKAIEALQACARQTSRAAWAGRVLKRGLARAIGAAS